MFSCYLKLSTNFSPEFQQTPWTNLQTLKQDRVEITYLFDTQFLIFRINILVKRLIIYGSKVLLLKLLRLTVDRFEV